MAYDRAFYESMDAWGTTSAEAVLPIVLELVRPASALDVGCGTGSWAATLQRFGVTDVAAVDGSHVPKDMLQIAQAHFLEADLRVSFSVDRRFDLVVCLEVAEHLEEQRAPGLVADLCRHGDAVLFSAAMPGQGGVEHVNERWLGYWVALFAEHGFVCCDVVRPRVRYDESVAWIYRQNCVLFCAAGHAALDSVPDTSIIRPVAADGVEFEYVARYILDREDGLAATVKRLPTLMTRAVGRRLSRGR